MKLPAGYIFYDNYYIVPISKISYLSRIEYEELIDSKGNKHIVCTNSKMIDFYPKKENFIINDKFINFKDNSFNVRNTEIQFNLIKYCVLTIDKTAGNFYSDFFNLNADRYKKITSTRINYRLANKYNFPIYENNYYRSESIISDNVFFSFKDREFALNNINYEAAQYLKEHNYLKMSDSDLINFLAKRMEEKAKLITKQIN